MTRAAAPMIPASERSVVRFIGRIFEFTGCNNANPDRLHVFSKGP